MATLDDARGGDGSGRPPRRLERGDRALQRATLRPAEPRNSHAYASPSSQTATTRVPRRGATRQPAPSASTTCRSAIPSVAGRSDELPHGTRPAASVHARRWTAPPQHAHAHASTTQPHAHARRRAGGRAGRLGGWAPRTTNRRHGAQGRSVRGGGRGPRLGSRTRVCVVAAAVARQLTPPCRSLHPPPPGPRSANCPPTTTNKPSRRRSGTPVTFCRTVPPRPPCP